MTAWPGWKLTKDVETAHGGHEQRAARRRRQVRREQEAVLAALRERAPALYSGQPVQMDQAQIDALLAAITEGVQGHDYRIRHNFFVRGLAKGVREGLWRAPVPAPVQVLRRQPSPFTPETFGILHQFNALYAIFHRSLALQPPRDAIWEGGQLLFAAIACGALLNPVWLCRFGPTLDQGMISGGGHLWLDLVDEKGVLRRWFADPVTGLLLQRFGRRHDLGVAQDWHTAAAILKPIRYFFCHQGGDTRLPILKTLPALLAAAGVWWQLRLPPYLAHYAGSRDLAPSLPPESWVRVYAQRRLLSEPVPAAEDLPTRSAANSSLPSGRGDVLAGYRRIRGLFHQHRGKRPQVKALIAKLEADLAQQPPFLLQALIGWSIALMRTRRYASKKLKPSSVATYLSAIGSDLLAHGLSLAPKAIDWNDLYEAVLSAAPSTRARSYRAARLKEFHRFLQDTYGVEAVDLEREAVDRRVDANLITPAEYLLIRDYLLQDERYPPRLQQIQALLLTLGFRLGLRRNEVRNLRIKDLQTNQGIEVDLPLQDLRPELLVRSSAYGSVKSTASVRRLPLTLLSPEELRQLLQFEKRRLRELGDTPCTDELLFCPEGADRTPLPDAETFLPIRQAMQKLTGDPNLRFHHLRHSFANWLLLRLMAEEIPEVLPQSWSGLPDRNLPPSRQLLLQAEPVGARKLYAVSQLLGHVDPKETLTSYLHLLDWILYQARCRALPRLDNDAQAAMMGMTPQAARVFRSRHGIQIDDLPSLWRRRLAASPKPAGTDPWLDQSRPLEPVTPPAIMGLAQNSPPPSPLLLYRILRQAAEGRSDKEIAACFGFSRGQIAAWIATARRLGKLRTTRGSPRFVRRQSLYQTDLNREPALPDLCPAPPHRETDRRDAIKIYDRILTLSWDDRAAVETGLQLFVNHTVASESLVRFRRLEDQQAWIAFLKQLFPKSRLRLTLYRSSKPLKAQQRHWSERFGIPRSQMLIHPSETSQSPLGRVDIWIAQEGVAPKLPTSADTESWPAPGLKFALYMASVYLGIEIKNGGSRNGPPER